MDYLNQAMEFLTTEFGPLGPLYAVGVLGLLLVLISLGIILNRKADPMDKLKKDAKKKTIKKVDNTPRLRHDDKGPKLDKYASFLEPQDQKTFSAAKLKLVQAGYRSRYGHPVPEVVRRYEAHGAGVKGRLCTDAPLRRDGATTPIRLRIWPTCCKPQCLHANSSCYDAGDPTVPSH